MHPRLEAGKDLQKIMHNLTSTTQSIFTKKLNEWHEKHKDFKEVSIYKLKAPKLV
jgi:hypothetical protein